MAYEALGYAARSIRRFPHRPPRARQAPADRAGDRQPVLPALPLADLGHLARRAARPAWNATARTPTAVRAGGSLDWLAELQITRCRGRLGWRCGRPAPPGGWAFQYRNDHYPDVDDTAVVVMALDRTRSRGCTARRSKRAADWIIAMQNENGGWGSFDAGERVHYALNHIPFADHGALLDPRDRRCHARAACDASSVSSGIRGSTITAVARGLAYHQAPSRKRTAPGSAAGAPTTSTAPGRCFPH